MRQSDAIAKPTLTKTMKTDTPPQALSDYFAATNDGRVDDAAACFTPDALVHDENHDHTGTEEIRAWIDNATRNYSPTVEVNDIQVVDGAYVATGLVSGTFPGSPVTLSFAFTLRDGKISHLAIQ